MASICAKCGSALSPNDLICKSCGAAAADGDAVAVFIPPTAASDKSGSGALKIILITIAVVVGLGILGLGAVGYIGYRMVKNTHVDSSGRVTMNTLVGTFTTTPAENLSAAELGTDIYPGAQSTHGSVRMQLPNGSGVMGAFLTSDSPAQVTAFYKDKLGSAATVRSFLGNTTVRLKINQLEFIEVKIYAFSNQNNGKTRFFISHTSYTKAS